MPHGADRFGGLALERGAQCRQVQVTVHTTKLFAGLGHPGRAPPSAICPSRQRLTLPACSRQTETIDSIQFVERKRPGERGRHTEAQNREGLVQALAQAGRRPGMGAVEFLWPGRAGLPRPPALIRRGRRRSSRGPHCFEVVVADGLSRSESGGFGSVGSPGDRARRPPPCAVVRAGSAEGAPCRDEFRPGRESVLVTVVGRRTTLPGTRHHGGHHGDHAERPDHRAARPPARR